MRNFFLAAAAVSFAAMTVPVAPATAGGCCRDYHHGHHGHGYGYEYSYVTRYHVPPPVVYKHYLPDEDDFHPKPKVHTYVPWYAGWEYSRVPLYSHRSSYGHGHYHKHRHYSRYKRSRDWDDKYDSDDDCRWLKRRAKESDSRYWWRRYEDCRD